MRARKKDPITGKCGLRPRDTKRVKRPKHKKRTPEENAKSRDSASMKQSTMRRSVKSQKVYHIVSFDGSNWAASAEASCERDCGIQNGKLIKPEYYCAEYKDVIDIRNAALVTALKEARAIKCEVPRQQVLRQIRRRKREPEVPDMPTAIWKNAKTGDRQWCFLPWRTSSAR